MKKMKKIFALFVTMVMVLGMSVSAMAASIDVQDVVDGETYTAYKILNYTKDGDAYSYYLTTAQYNSFGSVLEGAGFIFQASADGTQYYVTNADQDKTTPTPVDVAAAAAYLKEHVSELGDAIDKKTATGADGEANFDGLTTGYYFITSSLGSLAALHDENGIATVVEKNTMLDDNKVVDENSTNAQVGDVLHYTITLTDGKGTNLAATVTDTLSKGLTFNSDAKASINGAEAVTVTPAVTTNADGSTKVVYTFDAATMTALNENETIVITYTATVNSDASLDGTEKNTEYTEYSEQKTDGNTVETSLTDMTVNKTDGTDALKGAQFKLYRTDAKLNLTHADVKLRQLTDDELTEAKIIKAADTVYYTVDTNGTNLIDMAQKSGDDYLYSSAVVYGLDKDSTYYLEETKAPEGYNLLNEEKEVTLGDTTSVDVVNQAGSVLPSTGGIGTTIFYVVGAILVIGAGVVMITRRRMDA
ncbi:MAG: SpaH/EbpB family LPXTG-anchored major pilin [Lachnospiraceae bacterium]|nr:SpaH/EbpB family LPXTG-anchored major pilin [Lachnospiraceae bacterium]